MTTDRNKETETMKTPEQIITEHGLASHYAVKSQSKRTKGKEYAVTITSQAADAPETFTYHSSHYDEQQGGAGPTGADVIGCLFMDASYVPADETDVEACADEMYEMWGGPEKPSHFMNLARQIIEQTAALRRLFPEGLPECDY